MLMQWAVQLFVETWNAATSHHTEGCMHISQQTTAESEARMPVAEN